MTTVDEALTAQLLRLRPEELRAMAAHVDREAESYVAISVRCRARAERYRALAEELELARGQILPQG